MSAEHLDVLFVGAGMSGICGAYHLKSACPDKSFVILEDKESHGGTWRQHSFPGARSDSSMYTFGYEFKSWGSTPIAPAGEILAYMQDVIDGNELARHIRYKHEVLKASWTSDDNLWTLEAVRTDTGETVRFTCHYLWMAQGYYRHAEGYTPDWPGFEDYEGKVVHPQTWPDDLDYADKTVIVIGSGATAATVVPAMAGVAGHVTMLQRSPTYFIAVPNKDDWVDPLREMGVPDEWAHELLRKRYINDEIELARYALNQPEEAREMLINDLAAQLPRDFDVATHFSPKYDPWRQRLAVIPDSDLLKSLSRGDASIVTDHIERFNKSGILLKSGNQLDADIIVTATGFNLCLLGDIEFFVDGAPVDFGKTHTYRGVFCTGVPNMAWIFGYLRYSWTLRADLLSKFVCRMLNKMDAEGARKVVPKLRTEDAAMATAPFIDTKEFNPGYIQRGIAQLPRQGDRMPWLYDQDYPKEKEAFQQCDLSDNGALTYE